MPSFFTLFKQCCFASMQCLFQMTFLIDHVEFSEKSNLIWRLVCAHWTYCHFFPGGKVPWLLLIYALCVREVQTFLINPPIILRICTSLYKIMFQIKAKSISTTLLKINISEISRLRKSSSIYYVRGRSYLN